MDQDYLRGIFRQTKGRLVWAMDLANYKRLRGAFWPEDDDRDPESVKPDPGDTLLGYPIDVRANGGEPRLTWRPDV